ncbi:MAG: hypothetical protein HZB26_09785 [Candidatus Hydrogenedentes bacterium]|nr:hypothetical protein [Candidatus Hydrogenedentota bacterium]
MQHSHKFRQNEGVALLIAAIFIAVAVIIIGALGMRVINASRQAQEFEYFAEAFNGAQSGYAQSVANLEAGATGNIGLGTWAPPAGGTSIVLPSFGADAAQLTPATLLGSPAVQYVSYVDNWFTDSIDNNSNGAIDDVTERDYYTVYAFARAHGIERGIEAVVKAVDVNVWRNAIFAGNGQAGGLINGNVSIHGAVHLLGGSLPVGGVAVDALDLSGTSLIHNNYTGIPADLASRVPALPTRTLNGEVVQTLNANLRVKKGLVGMSGNSEIGEANIAGNALKETMDGTYVGDGWTGTSVNNDGGRGDPTRLYSDNGWDNGYDMGDKVPMPFLSNDWRDPVTGATVINPATGVNYTHAEYFHANLAQTPYTGNMTIKANQNFYYNATHPTQTDPALRAATDHYIYFNAATNVMYINGQIEVNGDLSIQRGTGSDKSITYTGRAAILVNGNTSLDTDLTSQNADGTTAMSFPANNFFGIMASGNMTVGSISQLNLMGAFYAQGTVTSTKQTITMGTFVGNYFNMGTNVPEIYQVPTLADNLPMGMIGAYPILIFSQVSWREVSQ